MAASRPALACRLHDAGASENRRQPEWLRAYSAPVRFIRFTGALSLCDLMLATWDVEPRQVRHALPAGFEPISDGGRSFVSVVGFCATNVRLGRLSVPSYSGVNVRTYVRDRGGAPAIFVLQSRVTPPGMGALLLGVPVRTTVIKVRRGVVSAAGMGVSAQYEIQDGPPELPPVEPAIGEFDLAYWKAAGVRRLATRHQPSGWQKAELREASRFDPVLALGFDVKQPRWLHYAERADFLLELPPRKISRH